MQTHKLWGLTSQHWLKRISLLVLYIFLLSTVIFYFKLDTLGATIYTHMQFLDLPELFNHPVDSLLQLHSQPPLLNAIIWALHLLPGDLYRNFIYLNIFCSACVSLIIFEISLRYFGSFIGAVLLSIVYLFSPANILYAAYPFYPVLTSFGYSILVLGLFICCQHTYRGVGLLALAVIYLSLLRTSFTLLHCIFALVLCAWQVRNNVRPLRFFAVSCIVCAVVLAIPFKNYLRYDFFGSSSWSSLNLVKGLFLYADIDIGAFPHSEMLHKTYPDLNCDKSYGLQDQQEFKSSGHINFNSCYFLAYAKLRKQTMFELYRPSWHAGRIMVHSKIYFGLPDKYEFLANRSGLGWYADQFDRIYLIAPLGKYGFRSLLVLLLIGTVWSAFKTRDKFILSCLTIILIHFFTHVLTDGEEAHRFVFDIEFLFYVCTAFIFFGIRHSLDFSKKQRLSLSTMRAIDNVKN